MQDVTELASKSIVFKLNTSVFTLLYIPYISIIRITTSPVNSKRYGITKKHFIRSFYRFSKVTITLVDIMTVRENKLTVYTACYSDVIS